MGRTVCAALVGLMLVGGGVATAQKKKAPPVAEPARVPAIDLDAAKKDLAGDEDHAVAAAERLRKARQPGVTDALLSAAALGVTPRVAAAILDALAEHPEKTSVDLLLTYTQNLNPQVRARAVYALGLVDDGRAREAVMRAFGDQDKDVRLAAGRAAAAGHIVGAADRLVALLKKGDEPSAAALAALATPDIARRVGELIGQAPDALVAQCLGAMLLRSDLGPEQAYVDVVRTIATIPGNDSLMALTTFLASVPEKSTRPSRKEAQALYEQRLSGGAN